jgi:SAM-dependent methyltransferase
MASNPGYRFTRFAVERLYGLRAVVAPPLDAVDFLYRAARGRGEFPPLSARQLVSGKFWAPTDEFDAVGRAEAESWRESMGLEPGHRLLDIGCGCGRVTRHVLRLLGPDGRYVGGDVDARAIRWCREHLGRRHPNSVFFHIDAYNSIYNPRSRQPASSYTFPLDDRSMDRVALSSVFTHMLPADVERYLQEMARVLVPGGRAYAGVFLVSPARLAGPEAEVVRRKFHVAREGHYLTSEKYPDLEVAYDEEAFAAMAARCGLPATGPVRWGQWTGAPGYRPLDVVVLERPA